MIVNQTKNDLELNALAAKRLSKKARILFSVAALMFLVLGIAVLCVEIFIPAEEPDYFDGIFFTVFGAIFLVFAVFLYPFVLKWACKRAMQGKYSDNRYTFTEEGYEIESKITEGEAASKTAGSYSSLTQVPEYCDLWLIYLNKATMFALRKDGMVEGTAEELTALLRSAVGARYKICFKIKN